MNRRLMRAGAGAVAALLAVATFELAAPAVAAVAPRGPAISAAQRQQRSVAGKKFLARRKQQAKAAGSAARGLAAVQRVHSQPARLGRLAASAATVTVTPDTDLRPGQRVAIDGHGFTAGLVFMAQCATDPANGLLDCDLDNRPLGFPGAAGTFSVSYSVSRNLHVSRGSVIDCATVVGGCTLEWANLDAPNEIGSVPLGFDPTAFVNPTIAVSPSVGLVHLQSVTVDGSGFAAADVVSIAQCPAGADPSDCTNTRAFMETDGLGSFNGTVTVRRIVTGPNGPVDCALVACELVATGASPEFVARSGVAFDPNGPMPEPVIATVAPDTGLLDRQMVALTASGFAPDDYGYVEQCTVPDSDGNGFGCTNGFTDVEFDSAGHLNTMFKVRRLVPTDAGLADSATVACEVHVYGFESQSDATAPIQFDATVPPPALPSIVATPATGLVHGQTIAVHGTGFDPDGLVSVSQCAPLGFCSSTFPVPTGSDGTLDMSLRVRRLLPGFDPGSDARTTIDCADPGADCTIEAYDESGIPASTTVTFAPGPPPARPVIELAPKRTLKDRQAVTLIGTSFFPGDSVYVAECAVDTTTDRTVACNNEMGADADESGHVSIPQRAFRQLRSAVDSGGVAMAPVVDCLDPGIKCVFDVSDFDDGFQVELPIRFDRGAPLAPPPMITVSPATKLRDRQTVTVRGTGFLAGAPVPLMQCDGAGFDAANACRRAGVVEAKPDGTFESTMTVRKMLLGPFDSADCGTTQCLIVAGDEFDDPLLPVVASITFDRGAPTHSPKIRVERRRNLVDGQLVTVTGSDYTPNTEVVLFECPTGVPGYAACDLKQSFELVPVDAHGRFSTQFAVEIAPKFASGDDCLTAPAGCSLFVSNAFDPSESVRRPIYFGTQSGASLQRRAASRLRSFIRR